LRDAVGSSAFTNAHVIRRLAPALVAALLAAAYMVIAPTGADLPAQLLRVRLFAAEGFSLWDNWWYGGHYVLGYSVLFPPLGWLIGPRLLAAIASVGTAAAFSALAHDVYGDDAWVGATWFAAATATELVSGRLTFAVGLCGAALTALLLERQRPRWAAVLALLTALISPVAALFTALAGAARTWVGVKRGRWADIACGIATISAGLTPVGVLAVAFPTGGHQPFALGTLWPLLLAGGFLLLVASSRVPGYPDGRVATYAGGPATGALRAAIVIYVLGCIAAYLIPTPLGSNAARLGELTAGPVAALLLVPRRAWLALALLALPLTYLQVHNALTDLERGSRASSAAYYRPLLDFLHRQPGLWRVEVPFTQGHWESYWLAPHVPLARGWERQTDIAEDPLFYGGRLSAASYDAWLHGLAVHYVTVADAPPDYSARAELELIRHGLPYLRLIAHLRHWTVYAVSDPTPIVGGVGRRAGDSGGPRAGAGRLMSLGPQSLTLAITHPGALVVRVRWSPYWQLSGVAGCVAPAGELTQIDARSRGRAVLRMSFTPARIGSRSARCD
jgi:hypothetical protein